MTPDLIVVAATDELLAATLMQREELIGQYLFDALPDNPDDPAATGVQRWRASLEKVLRTKAPHTMALQKYSVRRPEAMGGGFEQKYWRPANYPILGSDGEMRYIVHKTEDVTKEVSAEASAQALANSFASASVGFLSADPEGRVLEVNPAFCELTDYSAEELIGRALVELNHPEDWPAAQAKLAQMLVGEISACLIEKRLLRKDGRPVWVQNSVSLVRDHEQRPQKFIVLIQDITERRRAQEALTRLNENLESTVEERTRERDRLWRLSKDMMVMTGFDGAIIAANPACTAVLGYTEEELRSFRAEELVHPEDQPARRAELSRLDEGHSTLRFECRYRHKDGSHRWVSWTAVPDEGRIHAIGRDITQEKEAAETLRRAEESLRQVQKMEAVGQLTGGIAHDFNNLLLGITGSLGLAERRIAQGRTDELGRFIGLALNSANRAAALTHRLLAFARRQPLDPKPTKVNELVTSIADLLRRSIGETIELKLSLAESNWSALCDASQLESAILNLAVNARDAMPDGGTLTIETSHASFDASTAKERGIKPGQYVCLCVADTGTGMPPQVLARAFEPFFTTKSIGQGTGLGLSMVYGFISQSEGYVKLDSEIGQGTTVKLYLPRSLHEGGAEDGSTGSGEAHQSKEGEVVLVVEDEQIVRSLVVEVLHELGYQTLEAGDGAAGLELLQSAAQVDLRKRSINLSVTHKSVIFAVVQERCPPLYLRAGQGRAR
jgi:PAS domain S-box-containing protein